MAGDASGEWLRRAADLQRLAQCQLFFIGGAPRSGTTWLQRLLDSHPEICCGGEGLFMKHLAEPLDALMVQRRGALEAKNSAVFREAGGYPLPAQGDADFLTGTAILVALAQQCAGQECRAVGEKTPENVFFFPRLKALFPHARFIAMARDPRDVLSSAWHFFHKAAPGEDPAAAKRAFIRLALPALQQGANATLALTRQYPADCMVVTYERLRAAPAMEAARLFRFLGVSDSDEIVSASVERTSFAAMTAGRAAGSVRAGSFFRKGVVGDWRTTFTPDMNDMILRELAWTFPLFGWEA